MQELVRDALSGILDPDIGINIVDLGLIDRIDTVDGVLTVTLIMTSPSCPQSRFLAREAEAALRKSLPPTPVRVTVADRPAWTPDRMSRAARDRLGWK